MSAQSFAVTGLFSRGGRSNWALFFERDELTMIDVGVGPSLVAGVKAGLGLRPQPADDPGLDLAKVRADAEAHAKLVVAVPLAQLRQVRVRLGMMAHELAIEEVAAPGRRFGFMQRAEALRVIPFLRAALGQRLEVQSSGIYEFLSKRVPFLTR